MSPEIANRRGPDPLQVVKESYGSLEEFAMTVLDVCPGYLEGEYGASEAAQALELPLNSFTKAVSTPDFNAILDQMASFAEYSFRERRIAMRNLASIATTAEKTTISRSGKPVRVDREADEIIKADTHLRKVQGRPLDQREGNASTGITIIFGGSNNDDAPPEIVVEAERSEGPKGRETYRRNTLGALPPTGARRFYDDDGERDAKQHRLHQEFDFSSEEAESSRDTGSVADAKTLGERKDE